MGRRGDAEVGWQGAGWYDWHVRWSMRKQTALNIRTELAAIKQRIRKIEREVDRLTVLVAGNDGELRREDLMAFVGLGSSGLSDIAERHDDYVGQAIGDSAQHIYSPHLVNPTQARDFKMEIRETRRVLKTHRV